MTRGDFVRETERKTLVAQVGRSIPGGKLTKDQVKALVTALRDIAGALAHAEPADNAEVYKERGVTLTYSPEGRVKVQARPRG